MDLNALKTVLTAAMPILDVNLDAANKEYMDGKLSAGAFQIVLGRHTVAYQVLTSEDIAADTAYAACALVAIDLRTGVADMPDTPAAQRVLDSWWACYRNAGYTATNQLFNVPSLPEKHCTAC